MYHSKIKCANSLEAAGISLGIIKFVNDNKCNDFSEYQKLFSTMELLIKAGSKTQKYLNGIQWTTSISDTYVQLIF